MFGEKEEGGLCNRILRRSEDSYKRLPLLFLTKGLKMFGEKEGEGPFVTEY